jgi:hypothetical protein
MTFDEALALAQQGKQLARTAEPSDLLLSQGGHLVVRMGGWCAHRPPTDAEREATDWEEVI